MSVLTDSCYSEDRYSAMGSIMCPETDTRTLEARKDIYASTNVRDHPRKGIIKPVCEYCRSRIDDNEQHCKHCIKKYVVEPMEEESIVIDESYDSVDPLAVTCGDETKKSDVPATDNGGKTVNLDDDNGLEGKQCSIKASRLGKKAILSKPTVCPVCGKWVKSLSDHMKIHSTDKKYTCIFCDKSYAQSNNLTYHLMKHTGEKPFKCDKCDKQFFNNSHLISHMKLHYDEKIFQCEICSKRFNHVGNLNKHRRVHFGEKPYGCEYCEMRFNNISNKKLHENRHRGERNIICEVGSKSFHDMHHLERHRTVHLSRYGKVKNGRKK